jgi:hypothetical protein
MKTIIVATVCLRAFGAGLFILGSSFGAFLLVEFLPQTLVIPYFVTHTTILMLLICAADLPYVHNSCSVRLWQLRKGVVAICSAPYSVLPGFLHKLHLTDLNYFIKLAVKCCDNSASFLCSERGHVRCVGLLRGDEEAVEEKSGKHYKFSLESF